MSPRCVFSPSAVSELFARKIMESSRSTQSQPRKKEIVHKEEPPRPLSLSSSSNLWQEIRKARSFSLLDSRLNVCPLRSLCMISRWPRPTAYLATSSSPRSSFTDRVCSEFLNRSLPSLTQGLRPGPVGPGLIRGPGLTCSPAGYLTSNCSKHSAS